MRAAAIASTALIVVPLTATVLAQLLRDRTLVLALLMYVPIWPIAVLAVARDVLARGRALPVRWLLLAVGLGAGAFSILLLWRPACSPEGDAAAPHITIAQWNVQWGGHRGAASSAEMLATLEDYHPDVICLSEAPDAEELRQAIDAGGAGRWHTASVEHSPPTRYWFRLTVLSREPVTLRQQWALPTGHAALFEVAFKPHPLRLLMVDLQSHPLLPRSPTIAQAARIVAELAATDVPVDIVTGDFNSPGRVIGFDALSEAANGYRRAAMWSGQWRATWPARLPLSPFDIDHLWVERGLDIASAELFSSPNTDHRGQVAVLRVGRDDLRAE